MVDKLEKFEDLITVGRHIELKLSRIPERYH